MDTFPALVVSTILTAIMFLVLLVYFKHSSKEKAPKDSLTAEEAIARFSAGLDLHKYIKEAMVKSYEGWAKGERFIPVKLVDAQAYYVAKLVRLLPGYEIMEAGNKAIKYKLAPVLQSWGEDDERLEDVTRWLYALEGFREVFNETEVGYYLSYKLRTQHHHIVAGAGHGKTQCIQSMIVDDWETDAAVVVIDSQGDLINNILAHAPLDRVVLIDPETCPPALNIFAQDVKGERELATAIELFEYIFSALEVKLTGQQSLVYRYLSRLLMEIPGATIETMRDLLQPGGTLPYQQYIDRLGPNAKAFFTEFQQERNNQYQETRQAVLRRLLMVLESETFAKMLSAPNMAFDFTELLDSGKTILINTSKDLLKGGSSLFGRIFIALVMQAVMSRKEERRRTYLYIDEFADYAEDSQVLFNLFEQARKYELGLIVCHQYLGQLPEQLRKSISANTAIKFAGGVSAEDARALASQMHTTPEEIHAVPALTFKAWFKGIGTVNWVVEPGRMEKTPRHDDMKLDVFRGRMRVTYGPNQSRAEPPPQPTKTLEEEDWSEP